jgi:hypothetical protein
MCKVEIESGALSIPEPLAAAYAATFTGPGVPSWKWQLDGGGLISADGSLEIIQVGAGQATVRANKAGRGALTVTCSSVGGECTVTSAPWNIHAASRSLSDKWQACMQHHKDQLPAVIGIGAALGIAGGAAAGAFIGALLGAFAGGPVGAAIGAGIGAPIGGVSGGFNGGGFAYGAVGVLCLLEVISE